MAETNELSSEGELEPETPGFPKPLPRRSERHNTPIVLPPLPSRKRVPSAAALARVKSKDQTLSRAAAYKQLQLASVDTQSEPIQSSSDPRVELEGLIEPQASQNSSQTLRSESSLLEMADGANPAPTERTQHQSVEPESRVLKFHTLGIIMLLSSLRMIMKTS
jgi:hypothetical protein